MPSPYRFVFDNLLTKVDPERAHHGAATLFRVLGRTPGLRDAVRVTLGRAPEGPAPELFGRATTGLLGLAAGFDKDATMAAGLDAVGFGFVEIGTVTAHAQPGNDKPRLFRVPERRALVNRMGFNNAGAAAAATRLRKLRRTPHGRRLVLGANLGKSKVTPADGAVEDYRTSARALAPYVDYLVVNVSSPNTPGLRDLQQTEVLRPILVAVLEAAWAAAAREVPVLVKIAPDLANSDVDAVADLAREIGLAGVVAVNTTIRHEQGAGGMSGPPVRERGLEVVARVRARLADDQVIIGVGGISTPADARAYLAAGANALQAYTAFIYGGATWPGAMNRAIGRG
ncbi:quinone-dependent dihydroorotate dehydrogenase [Occultella glacieicola]|uniref:Dihydroorotate dehydrogenase (quinone) n=1 Tax=Occultella glacieicola TaxID=2518684 RepID=A0ABY2DYA0_9MICO|nr:quinone-dependent dihydroorotate dehydrogenase [Occultella glacieicola]TDE88978.1 quinone-dependent dihydroorotate dehydrogenase [Occultella glacieicola]